MLKICQQIKAHHGKFSVPGKALIDPNISDDEETLLPEWLGEYLVPDSFGDYVGEGWLGENKGKVLGYEAVYLGDAVVERFSDLSTISIVQLFAGNI